MQVPIPFPDEVLFSRLVRHLTLSGMQAHDYLEWVLGNPRTSVHPYLTAGIERIAKVFGENATSLLKDQTLAPIFTYYLPRYAERSASALLLNRGSEAIRSCQLASFKESEVLSLKYCPSCVKQDIQELGASYWHRSHQIPGIEACLRHGEWLVHVLLPDRPHIHAGFLPYITPTRKPCSQLGQALAQFSAYQLARISSISTPFKLDLYASQLDAKGYMTKGGRYRRQRLSSDFYEFVQRLNYPSCELLPHSSEDYKYLSYLLSEESTQHPFKYLLFEFWLSLELSGKSRKPSCERKNTQVNQQMDVEQKCISLLQDGLSMAAVSRATGKSRCYIKALALREGVHVNLKPKVLTLSVKEQIVALARKGFHRRLIANLFNVSTGSVEMLISAEPGLVERRQRIKFESKRRRYMAQIVRFVRDNPNSHRQMIKQCCNAAFYWLYSHERGWLESVLPSATKPKSKSRVDWKSRDLVLVNEVKSILKQYDYDLSRTQLDKLLGGHGWLTKFKDKLPKTLEVYFRLYKQ